MKTRVTQTDVARAAGVHNTTVSLALRNSPLIPAATRERIRAIAQSLGYAPDPALRALAAYRNSCRERTRVETLVYLTTGETRPDWRQLTVQEQYCAAARRKAAELGFQFRPVQLDEPGMNSRRLDRMLRHEDIRCVLLATRGPLDGEWSALTWSRLCALRIGGPPPPAPELHQVTLDIGAIVRLALQRVGLGGYRHIGLAVNRRLDELEDRAWSAAFQAEQYRNGVRNPLPVLYLPDAPPAECSVLLARWHRTCRPEVILGLSPHFLHQLRQAGLRPPGDVAYADLSLQDAFQTIAGVREHCARVGELAVEMLSGQLMQNQFGPPAVPTVTLIGGEWCDGASLPARQPAIAHALPVPAPALRDNLVA